MAGKLKPCRTCGVPCVGPWCDKHTRPVRKQEGRPTFRERGYTTQWDKASKRFRSANPFCMDCLKEGRYSQATEVHHVVKVKHAPGMLLDTDNLMALCAACHSTRSRRGE